MKRKTKVEHRARKNDQSIDSDGSFDQEEVNQMKELIETSEKSKKVNLLKRKFGLCQKELLHFVNNLDFFVGYSVIKHNL